MMSISFLDPFWRIQCLFGLQKHRNPLKLFPLSQKESDFEMIPKIMEWHVEQSFRKNNVWWYKKSVLQC